VGDRQPRGKGKATHNPQKKCPEPIVNKEGNKKIGGERETGGPEGDCKRTGVAVVAGGNKEPGKMADYEASTRQGKRWASGTNKKITHTGGTGSHDEKAGRTPDLHAKPKVKGEK